MPKQVRVKVPASTANLGPGFDVLGLALGIHNTLSLWVGEEQCQLTVTGEGVGRVPTDASNLIFQAAFRVYDKLGEPRPVLHGRAENGIPLSSGMGSSAAATVSGLVAANALLGAPLSRQSLLGLACELEGHADNAAAALFGGLTLVAESSDGLHCLQKDVAPMQVAIALPATKLSTRDARNALPTQVPHSDAVFNVGKALFVVSALQTADYEMLAWAMQDRLHEPYRLPLMPGTQAAKHAALAAGAKAVAVSGAGPSLAAFAPSGHSAIANAMHAAFGTAGIESRTFVLPVDRQGVQISMSL
jgi:homoserine kinase